jgi:hypothetical protein
LPNLAVDIKRYTNFHCPYLRLDSDLDFEKMGREYSRAFEIFEMLCNVGELLRTLGRGVTRMAGVVRISRVIAAKFGKIRNMRQR